MTSNLFSSPRIYDPRYLWDPSVHRHFGEDLYFFIVRAENPTPAYYADLREECARSSISWYCLYKLYGYYDGLLRVWANNEKIRELRDNLRVRLPEEAIEFRVDKAYFDGWSKHLDHVDDRLLLQAEPDVVQVSRAQGDIVSIKAALERLRSQRLVHHLEPRKSFRSGDFPLLKFYCTLGPSRLLNDFPGGSSRIREVVQGVEGIRLRSLYFGSADHVDVGCLIKGVVSSKDLGQLDGWIDDLYESLRAVGRDFRRQTLVIANTESPEADLVDCEGSELGLKGQMLRRMLGPEFAVLLYELPRKEKQHLIDLFDYYRLIFVGTQFERYFLGLLEARLSRDSELLTEKLTFLLSLEASARGYMRNAVLVPQLGGGWYQRVLDTARALEQKKKRGRAIDADATAEPLLGLVEYVRVVEALTAKGEVNTVPLVAKLGDKWGTRLVGVGELRNKWAHGSLGEWLNKGGAWAGWPEVGKRACEAGQVFNALSSEA